MLLLMLLLMLEAGAELELCSPRSRDVALSCRGAATPCDNAVIVVEVVELCVDTAKVHDSGP